MMVVKPKTTQSIEPNKQPVDQFSSTDWRVQKPYLFSRMLVQQIKGQSRYNGHLSSIKY